MNDLMNKALEVLNRTVRLKTYFHGEGNSRMFSVYSQEEMGMLEMLNALGIKVKYKDFSLEYELV